MKARTPGFDGGSTSRDPLTCPKCKQFVVGPNAVRMKSSPKLTKHMQKLLRKRNQNKKSLTERQHVLLNRAMQRCNVLVLKCSPCDWREEIKLLSKEAIQKHKASLRKRIERERLAELQAGVEESTEAQDKKALKKLRKKEKRKKSLEAKALELQHFKRLTSTPIAQGTTEKRIETPMVTPVSSSHLVSSSLSERSSFSRTPLPETGKSASVETPSLSHTKTGNRTFVKPDRTPSGPLSGVQKGRVNKKQLQKVLNQKKKEKLSASESLSQFLNSLK